eukprot:COSAG01_NODE_2337_length_7874_cov_35.702508_2_plen_82_part_00
MGGKKKKLRVMPAAVREYVEAAPLEALKNIVEIALLPAATLDELKNFVEMQAKKRKVMADMVRQAKEVGLTAADIVTLLGQ